jgi:hypothetical protein
VACDRKLNIGTVEQSIVQRGENKILRMSGHVEGMETIHCIPTGKLGKGCPKAQ